MAMDYDPNLGAPGPPTTLYFCDTGNGVIRAASLTGNNVVSTLIAAPSCQGLAYDGMLRQLIVTNANNTIALVNPTTGTAQGFAGQINVAGTANGQGIVAYPLQFQPGNAVSSGGAAATPFNGLGLTPNTGVNNTAATFSNPMGIWWDNGINGYWLVDNATAQVRVLN